MGRSLRIRFGVIATLAVAVLVVASCGREAPITYPAPTGSIEVTSSVSGAAILINGAPTGLVTPDTIPDLEVDTYRVTVQLTAHAVTPEYRDVLVVDHQVVGADFDLELTGVGRIAVTSTPAGATILLDGNDTGLVTPDTIPDVLIGTREVTVQLAGYEAAPPSRSIEVLENQTHSADFTLVVPPPAIVLLEEFSNVDCVGCPDLAAVTHALQGTEGYGLDRLLLVNISGTFPDPFDPHYEAAQAAHDTRLGYYDAFTGLNFPSLMLNGSLEYEANLGVDPLTYEALQASVDTALQADPGFTITVDADLELIEVPVTVTLTSVRDLDLTGYRLGVYLVEEEIDYPRGAPGSNGQTTFHWMLRDYDQVDSIPTLLEAGNPAVLNAAITRNLAWDGTMIIAFIQQGTTQEILQAGSTAEAVQAGPSLSSIVNVPSTHRSGGTP